MLSLAQAQFDNCFKITNHHLHVEQWASPKEEDVSAILTLIYSRKEKIAAIMRFKWAHSICRYGLERCFQK